MATEKKQDAARSTINMDINNDHRYKIALLFTLLLAMPTVEANKVDDAAVPVEAPAAQKEQPDEDTLFRAYANSDYHYDDAALLAKLWKISVVEAKHAIGRKVINQIEDLLPAAVIARHKERLNESDHHAEEADSDRQYTAYVNSNYHYEDAALLAKLWKIPVVEAKQTIGRKIINRIEDLLPTEVIAQHKKHLNAGGHHAKKKNSNALYTAYVNSDYQYDDATLLAKLWKIPVVEAKHAIGRKIINRIEDLLPAEVIAQHKKRLNAGDHHEGRNDAEAMFTAYVRSDYQYDDAALLAKLWKTSIAEAKQAIGRKVTHQMEDSLPAEVIALRQKRLNARANDAEAMFTAYANSNYHYDDAALLAKLWKISVMEAKQTIGRKITHQIEDLLPAEVQALHKKRLNAG